MAVHCSAHVHVHNKQQSWVNHLCLIYPFKYLQELPYPDKIHNSPTFTAPCRCKCEPGTSPTTAWPHSLSSSRKLSESFPGAPASHMHETSTCAAPPVPDGSRRYRFKLKFPGLWIHAPMWQVCGSADDSLKAALDGRYLIFKCLYCQHNHHDIADLFPLLYSIANISESRAVYWITGHNHVLWPNW